MEHSKHSNDITSASLLGVGNVPEPGVGICQVYFRISPELQQRVADLAHERKTTKRAIYIAAVEAYLNRATEPGMEGM